jgi:hypothetical protein
MLSLEQSGYRDLARVLQEWAAVHAPDWTDANDADPGVTLLALFAFLTESLEARGDAIPERGRLSAARLARSALALAGMNASAPGCALARNRYFSGRLLGAEDFQLEQDYVRDRLRRHNRTLHGAGIVCGLQVSVRSDGQNGEQVVVEPGVALDPNGEEIEVPCAASAGLPEAGSELSVMVTHAERLTHPVAASDDEPVQFTRIEETFALQVTATAGQNGIVLARLIRTTGGWKVDEGFAVARVQCRQE